jgi:uncharacterized protein YndB with AHSA1/START domain
VGGHDAERSSSQHGVAFVVHNFVAHSRARPERAWEALTEPNQTAAFLYGMAAHSTWLVDDPIDFRDRDCDGVRLTGRVLCVRPPERLSYLMRSGPADPPVYVTWSIRSAPNGCAISLEVDEVEAIDSRVDAEDTWLPVLGALQRMLDSG